MILSSRSRRNVILSLVALVTIIGAFMAAMASRGSIPGAHAAHSTRSAALDGPLCTEKAICADVDVALTYENKYVGHDEPSTLFYSGVPGSGNRMRYRLTLPTDPAPANPQAPGKSFNFQLHPAFWFGMAMCDTQSFPEQVSTCTPDSDSNIVDPAISPNHPGVAFTELQFYPPGWVPWPAGNSCDATKWCAALNIDSFSQNSVTGQFNNSACWSLVGDEPVNFAFLTRNGVVQGPADPVDNATSATTFTPDPTKDLFMNSGDTLVVTLRDSADGLRTEIVDLTTHQSGFMVASVANQFGQVKFDPTATTCTNIPAAFHPMYSTSSEQTRVTWAAHSYNIAFADEIGHFDFCDNVSDGGCSGNEGTGIDKETNDGDDAGCFPTSASTLVQVSGCLGTNAGFDGQSYQPVWPDGNTALHPTPILFSSPLTGAGFSTNYSRVAFEADLPRIETSGVALVATCNRNSGAGCTLIPDYR